MLPVITSYSIHYTKLYDRFIIPLLIRELETLSKIDFTAVLDSVEEPFLQIQHFFTREPVNINEKNFLDLISENIGAQIDFSNRITSYNVCYTKLLRSIP